MLGHAGVTAAVRDPPGGGPTHDKFGIEGNEAQVLPMSSVPGRPSGRFGFECRVASGHPGSVNVRYLLPIFGSHAPDLERQVRAGLVPHGVLGPTRSAKRAWTLWSMSSTIGRTI